MKGVSKEESNKANGREIEKFRFYERKMKQNVSEKEYTGQWNLVVEVDLKEE
jgi:hypothetical protein